LEHGNPRASCGLSRELLSAQLFRADDGWGGSDLAYLRIHVLQLPRAYDERVTVSRNGTAITSIYVEDQDTPPGDLFVEFRPPAGISVHFLGMEEPPYYYGAYYGYAPLVEVSVDQTLCPGT